jgi:hypothetical protein
MKLSTYNYGFNFKTTKDITKADYILMCQIITNKLNELHNTNEYKILPEPITEGGFVFTNLNYKSLRIHIINQGFKYPSIKISVASDWTNNNDVLIKANLKGSTFLKAFHDASEWTLNELKIFQDTFQTFGAVCSKFPKKL